jgi:hypothetical protein
MLARSIPRYCVAHRREGHRKVSPAAAVCARTGEGARVGEGQRAVWPVARHPTIRSMVRLIRLLGYCRQESCRGVNRSGPEAGEPRGAALHARALQVLQHLEVRPRDLDEGGVFITAAHGALICIGI